MGRVNIPYRKSRRQCFDGQERITVRASRGIKKNMEGKKTSELNANDPGSAF